MMGHDEREEMRDDAARGQAESETQHEPARLAPPTDAGDHNAPKRETSWPTVLAIIAFVWGGLSVLFSGCTMLMSPFYGSTAEMYEDMGLYDEAEAMRMMGDLWWWWVIDGVIGLALAILLIVAGIGLVKRALFGARQARLWSVLSIVKIAIMTPIGFYLMYANGQDPADDPAAQWEMWLGIISGALATIFVLILPVFFMIWFARQRIRQEVSDWPP